ncbi:patatin-like phospholipase protein [Ceratobasidium sp. AG-Ba]|nr:patatin-like phospholipase protein [Ceratobasidium sp. AG-Ba]QRW02517.1 patatin-like phospholipase protein [Ceratobasidium sp. AG-Ba]
MADGGGIRGLSSLYILREIMRRLNAKLNGSGQQSVEVSPWQVFDMICGTSTGGLIAIMLGRLHMSVEDTIKAYVSLSRSIFSETKWPWKEGKFKASLLERAVKMTVGANTPPGTQALEVDKITERDRDELVKRGQTVMMANSDQSADTCPTYVLTTPFVVALLTIPHSFVCAVRADAASDAWHFRTYDVVENASPKCTIWRAARATSAAPSFFKPAIIDQEGLLARYLDGGVGFNNPTVQLLNEAAQQFPGRPVCCILSLGTGHRDVIRLRPAGGIPKLQLLGIVGVLKGIATDCEETHNLLARRFQDSDVYHRFNVEQGLQGVGLEEWKRLSRVQAHTAAYTRRVQVNSDINTVVEKIIARRGGMTIETANGQ